VGGSRDLKSEIGAAANADNRCVFSVCWSRRGAICLQVLAEFGFADAFELRQIHDRLITIVPLPRQAAQAEMVAAAVEAVGFDFWDVVHALFAYHAGPLGTSWFQPPDHACARPTWQDGTCEACPPASLTVAPPGGATVAANILTKHHGLSLSCWQN